MPKYRNKRRGLLSIAITTVVTFIIFCATALFDSRNFSLDRFLHLVPLWFLFAVVVGFFDWFLALRFPLPYVKPSQMRGRIRRRSRSPLSQRRNNFT